MNMRGHMSFIFNYQWAVRHNPRSLSSSFTRTIGEVYPEGPHGERPRNTQPRVGRTKVSTSFELFVDRKPMNLRVDAGLTRHADMRRSLQSTTRATPVNAHRLDGANTLIETNRFSLILERKSNGNIQFMYMWLKALFLLTLALNSTTTA